MIGAGQFCTNPGVSFVVAGGEAGALIDAAARKLQTPPPPPMLTQGIARAFHGGCEQRMGAPGLETVVVHESEGRQALPVLLKTTGTTWRQNHALPRRCSARSASSSCSTAPRRWSTSRAVSRAN